MRWPLFIFLVINGALVDLPPQEAAKVLDQLAVNGQSWCSTQSYSGPFALPPCVGAPP